MNGTSFATFHSEYLSLRSDLTFLATVSLHFGTNYLFLNCKLVIFYRDYIFVLCTHKEMV